MDCIICESCYKSSVLEILCLTCRTRFIGMDCVISELFYKGAILQRNYRKMTLNGNFL